uniref:ABC-type sugar transport systems, ATPase components n=1 Tax=uncultured alpha proteobacterium HF0070_34E11 TaxID=710807 RepID=E0XXK5_9PROT|nr:ABC-type sugar transport systems, ATPase components [uncultured alpha proteobacterium HF0070_34E11]
MLGLRPEYIVDSKLRKGRDLQLASCEVDVVEPAGADTYVLINLGGTEVTARLQAKTEAKAGVVMKFTFSMEKVSYFDASTGKHLN